MHNKLLLFWHHLHFHPRKKDRVVISIILRQFGKGMTDVFIPIYMFVIGFSLTQISLYFMGLYIAKFLMQFFIMRFVLKVGIHHALSTSYVLLAAYMLLLYNLPDNSWILAPAAVFGAAMNILFWDARHMDLAQLFSHNEMNKNIRLITILGIVVGIVSPFIGGLISEEFGPRVALLAAFGVLILASVFIRTELRDENRHNELLKLPRKLKFGWKNVKGDLISSASIDFQDHVANIFWPLYMFVILDSFASVGAFLSINTIPSVLLTFWVGSKRNRRPFIFWGSIVRGFAHMTKAFGSTTGTVFAADAAGSTAFAAYGSPRTAQYYVNAKENNILPYVVIMEKAGDFGKALMFAVVAGISLVFETQTALQVLFLIVAPVTVGIACIKDYK